MIAIEKNRSLRITADQRVEVRANAEAAAGALLPRIDASYAVSRTNSPINVFGDKLLQKRFAASDFSIANLNNPGTINNYHTDISITVPIYQGGALWAGKHAGEASATSAEWRYKAQRQATILHVIETFSLLKDLQAERIAAKQALAAAHDHLANTQALKRRGLAIVSDVMDAKSHMLEAEVTLQSASYAVTSTREQLQRLLGFPSGTTFSTSDTIKLAIADQTSAAWLQAASQSQPQLQMAKHHLNVAQYHADAAKAPFRPHVNLHAIEAWNSNTAAPKNGNATIAAEVQFNLFSGGSDWGRLQAAYAVTAIRELALQDMMQAIHNNVLSTWRGLQEAKTRLTASQQVLRQSLESLRIRKLREQQGLERSGDVLDAQSRSDQAHAKVIRARYALIIAKARLLAAAGQLTPEVIQ